MLLHDVSLLGLHVVLAIDRAGLVGEDGETHHGVFDVGFLRQIPGMKVFCPASQAEMRRMMRAAVVEETGPVAVRYPKGGDGIYQNEQWEDIRCDVPALTIVTYGTTINSVMEVCKTLEQEQIHTDVIKLDVISPLDVQSICTSVSRSRRVLIVEEAADAGCVAHEIFSVLANTGDGIKGKALNLGNGILPHGDLNTLRAIGAIDANAIYRTAKELLYEE